MLAASNLQSFPSLFCRFATRHADTADTEDNGITSGRKRVLISGTVETIYGKLLQKNQRMVIDIGIESRKRRKVLRDSIGHVDNPLFDDI